MFETIYGLLFTPSDDAFNKYPWESIYQSGGLILIFTSVIVCAVYYLFFGYRSPKYATIPKWLLSMLINGLLIFIISISIIGFGICSVVDGFSEIPRDIWIFSIYNMIYGFILYFVPLSILIKYASSHCRYTPF